MKFKLLFIIFLFFLLIPVYGQDFNDVKFIKNYDGDTFTFDLGENLPELFRTMPLRLYGIDTPEMKGTQKEKATQVRDFAYMQLREAKVINLVDCSKDKYFRILCRVNYDEKDLTQELLKRNMGYPYYGGKKQLTNN